MPARHFVGRQSELVWLNQHLEGAAPALLILQETSLEMGATGPIVERIERELPDHLAAVYEEVALALLARRARVRTGEPCTPWRNVASGPQARRDGGGCFFLGPNAKLGRWLCAGLLGLLLTGGARAESCLECHAAEQPATYHRFVERACTSCHGGQPDQQEALAAHQGMTAYPGDLAQAPQRCGGCHAAQVQGVLSSPMHQGADMVETTRRIFGEEVAGRSHSLQQLSDSPADSLLRRLCAGCHLGRSKGRHGVDVVLDRGGGCVACHVNAYPVKGHPQLTARVEDGRCFGCHSRSGRIALSYAGLGEVVPGEGAKRRLSRLADGRLMEHKSADVHHRASMACIDCHTGAGLMEGRAAPPMRRADVACEDCHDPQRSIALADWPEDFAGLKRRAIAWLRERKGGQKGRFPVTASGTPLWNVLIAEGRTLLYPKLGGSVREVPRFGAGHRTRLIEHARLTCDACHAAWAPQCYGCHLRFEEQGEQWDHLRQGAAPGRWIERRWDFRNEVPPIRQREDGRFDVVVPGMIMEVEHPDLPGGLRVRRFSALSPHTSGKARDCGSCHLPTGGDAEDLQ